MVMTKDGGRKPKKQKTVPIPAPASENSSFASIKAPPRKNEFSNVNHWWLVDLHANPPMNQGASRLLRQCMEEYTWDETYARRVLHAYRQFLALVKTKKDWRTLNLCPSEDVDKMWKCHIMDTTNYVHDCVLLCGCVIGRSYPNNVADEARRRSTALALVSRFGHQDVDKSSDGPWKECFPEVEAAPAPLVTPKTEPPNEDGRLTIRLRDATGEETLFQIKTTTEMGKVRASYATRKKVDPKTILLVLADGSRQVMDGDCPRLLGFQDNACVDVIMLPEQK